MRPLQLRVRAEGAVLARKYRCWHSSVGMKLAIGALLTACGFSL
jgi:hypothetical protein